MCKSLRTHVFFDLLVQNMEEFNTVGAAYYNHGLYNQPLIMTNLVWSGISPFKILRLI